MKDGDLQQRNEISKALLNVFPNAIEGSYRQHIGKTLYSKLIIIVIFDH